MKRKASTLWVLFEDDPAASGLVVLAADKSRRTVESARRFWRKGLGNRLLTFRIVRYVPLPKRRKVTPKKKLPELHAGQRVRRVSDHNSIGVVQSVQPFTVTDTSSGFWLLNTKRHWWEPVVPQRRKAGKRG